MFERIEENGRVIDHKFTCDCESCAVSVLTGSTVPRLPVNWAQLEVQGEAGDLIVKLNLDVCDIHLDEILLLVGDKPKGRGWRDLQGNPACPPGPEHNRAGRSS